MTRANIKWVDSEKKALIEKTVELFIKNPTESLIPMFDFAQKNVLESDRRRKIATFSSIPWFNPMFKEVFMNKINSNVETVEIETVREKDLKSVDTETLIAELVERFNKSTLLRYCISQISAPFIEQFKIEAGLATRHINMHGNGNGKDLKINIDVNQNGVQKGSLKKVLIMGLKPNQQSDIISRFSNKFDLKFHYNEKNQTTTPVPSNGSDYIIVSVEAVGHGQIGSMRSNMKKGAQIIRVKGSISSITRTLREIVQKETGNDQKQR